MVDNQKQHKLHHNHNYYLTCFAAGAFACGVINTIVEPFNLIRIKKMIDHQYSQSTVSALKRLIHTKQITLGLVPNFIGRSMYGFGRFGFYEIFKDFYQFIIGEERAKNHKIVGWSLAAGLAEAIGCMLYCPWQMIKLKIHLSRPGFQYPNNTIAVLKRIYQQQGSSQFFRNLHKQIYQNIPKTILKFILYEKLNQIIYNSSYFLPKQPASEQKLPQILTHPSTKISVSFLCGLLSGIILAVHMVPFDKIIIRYYSENHIHHNGHKTLTQFIAFVYNSEGIGGVFGGTFRRIALISILEGSQWAIYQSVKVLNGWETTGSSIIY